MNDSSVWSVDRIAAANLKMALGLALNEDQMERIAAHFSRHRTSAYQWAAERAQSHIVKALEAESMGAGPRYRDGWTDGYMRAEQVVMRMTRQDLIGIDTRESRTTGQVLRAMVRQARRR